MSMGSSARLAYGFYLGCPDEGSWKVDEVDEYGSLLDGHWMADIESDYENEMRRRLLRAGNVSQEEIDLAQYSLSALMAKHLGVDICWTGHLEYTHISLVASGMTFKASGTVPQAIDPLTFTPAQYLLAEGRLSRALERLEMTPQQMTASWLLCAVYA